MSDCVSVCVCVCVCVPVCVFDGGCGGEREYFADEEVVENEEEGVCALMKLVPVLDSLNHCMPLFLLIEVNYRILIFLCRLGERETVPVVWGDGRRDMKTDVCLLNLLMSESFLSSETLVRVTAVS